MTEKGGGTGWVEESSVLGLLWVLGNLCESLRADWFGNPSNTLEPSLLIHSPGSWVTLLLKFRAVVSRVWWNVLGLQPVGVIVHKYK
jgi:hypothetical protein